MGIPDVFEVINVPGLLCFSRFSKTCFLMSNRSTTTSMIQSTSPTLAMSSSRFPVVIRFADESASGYRFLGGQADVQIYTQQSNVVLNALGWFWIRFMSWLSHVY